MKEKYLTKLINSMKNNSIDACFIAPGEELLFLVGKTPHLGERLQGLFIKTNGDYFYIVNGVSSDEAIITYGQENVYIWYDIDGFIPETKMMFEEKNLIGKTIATSTTVRAFNILEIMANIDVTFVNGKNIVEDMRLYKDNLELELLKQSSRKNDEAMAQIIDYIKPGMTENDVYQKLITIYESLGCELEFAIIASGENSALPHYSDYDRVIEKNDIVLLDIGAKYENFCSDMTRTIFIGNVSKEQRKRYEIVKKAVLEAEKAIQIGTKLAKVDKIARDIVESEYKNIAFNNRLGHGIGYSVHEAPDIKQSSDLVFEKGMVFSIEPGIYDTGNYGIRIEDIVMITDDGPVVLNEFNKDIIIK